MERVVERFLKYVKYDTQSSMDTKTTPSTPGQKVLGETLAKELEQIGMKDVSMDQNGYIMVTLPSNMDIGVPTIGLIAHMDTALDASGKDVNPQIVSNYDGEDIILKNGLVLSPKEYPVLKNYKGQDIITTDGTTLLGADNKAGIAEIITAVEYLINNPQIKHGTIRVAFTPDEEIGEGADNFDVKKFNADFAYTIDGGEIGEIEMENFNAAHAKININGKSIHTGTAKDKLVNSISIASELMAMLPAGQKPEYTEQYEGFFHVNDIRGKIEHTYLYMIIRDHDKPKLNEKKKLILDIVNFLNAKYDPGTVDMELEDQYFNMREHIEPVMHIVDMAKKAMEQVGIEPKQRAIRGGTDGARLTYMGLPTPNIFTGGHNFHGRYEYIPIPSMVKAVEVILKIVELNNSYKK
ncbi:MAG: peptidase T [Clostridiales bacterium GWB2_37_7]|nr:MAG: peptidase T [Clostridiales bacterium GWB2_37_7]